MKIPQTQEKLDNWLRAHRNMKISGVRAFKNAQNQGNQEGCAICGFKGQGHEIRMHVHHINGNNHDNRPENLIPLCPEHHRKAHTGKLRLLR
jgi:5-methylcytosine-specific restriction endonuclease McrA